MEAEFSPKCERGESKTGGIHKNYRGRIDPSGRRRSKRQGSGKRRHLGDGITNVGTNPEELSKRFNALEESKK